MRHLHSSQFAPTQDTDSRLSHSSHPPLQSTPAYSNHHANVTHCQFAPSMHVITSRHQCAHAGRLSGRCCSLYAHSATNTHNATGAFSAQERPTNQYRTDHNLLWCTSRETQAACPWLQQLP
mmetsp:Transcript_37003/g.82261  ORF Transcript_37003/g.82261 Transcript_37003/m.82261 type:complete len:122 (+) Transcript_37003:125-490(+)